jgi:hypothetical protein
MSTSIDHLVVAARTLDEGVAWCEATLGIVPAAGGRHALMGTHNRLASLAAPACPRAYLEIIAIDPQAPPPGRVRWYDLDDAGMQALLARGPQLIHWVLGCDDIDDRCRRLAAAGIDRGAVLDVERATPQGPLRWRISVRDDGARLAAGALPTLIEWGSRHPVDTLPASGVALEALQVGGLPAAAAALCSAPAVHHASGAPALVAALQTPRGPVALRSPS